MHHRKARPWTRASSRTSARRPRPPQSRTNRAARDRARRAQYNRTTAAFGARVINRCSTAARFTPAPPRGRHDQDTQLSTAASYSSAKKPTLPIRLVKRAAKMSPSGSEHGAVISTSPGCSGVGKSKKPRCFGAETCFKIGPTPIRCSPTCLITARAFPKPAHQTVWGRTRPLVEVKPRRRSCGS